MKIIFQNKQKKILSSWQQQEKTAEVIFPILRTSMEHYMLYREAFLNRIHSYNHDKKQNGPDPTEESEFTNYSSLTFCP